MDRGEARSYFNGQMMKFIKISAADESGNTTEIPSFPRMRNNLIIALAKMSMKG